MSDYIGHRSATGGREPKAGPSGIAKVEYATSEKSEGPGGDAVSDSATELHPLLEVENGGRRVPSIFPGGLSSLLAHTDGDEKTQSPLLT